MRPTVTTSILAVLLLPTAVLAQTPLGDRYVCYKAALAAKQPKFSSVQKTLQDQFWTFTADVKGFSSLCNPVLAAQRPTVHQVGYKTTIAKAKPAQKFVKSDHTAFDQFGSHALTVVKPLELWAPSAKALGAGGTPTADTTGVDHFECYKAVPQKGAPKFVPTTVPITDQFWTVSLTLTKISKLCAPVNKNGEDPTAPQHPGHLVCYQAKLPKGTKFAKPTVSVNNSNFGPAVLSTKAVAELCVPALKDTIATPGPTPTATPRPTATPTPRPTATCSVQNCPQPGFCQNGACVTACNSTTCPFDEVCCSSGPDNGVCCDRGTQRCSQTQTSCQTVSCPSGSTYVPSINDCCPNVDLCGEQYPLGIPGTDPDPDFPAFCCIRGIQTCEPSSLQNPTPYGSSCVFINPTPTPAPTPRP